MPVSMIAAQLYTLRDHLRTPEDIERTLHRVKDLGYDAAQLSALGPIDPHDLKRILDDAGISVCATHVPFERLRDDLEAVVEEHRLWNCTYVAIGGLPADYRNVEGYHRFAKEGSEVARNLKAHGLTFGYHNHSFELERFNGVTGLEILYSESDPAVFTGEIDTYWIQHGGGDPAWWIRRMSGRIPVIHLKDMAVKGNDPIMAEVGEGNLNWEAILPACKDAGVQWYVVEQDWCQGDPFDSLALSLRNLRKMGIQ